MGQSYVDLVGYTEDDVLYSVFPLFHANAKYMSVLIAIAAGARVVIHRRFSASRFWEICRAEGVTAFNGLGEMLRILLKQPESERDGDNQVRMVIGSAAPEDVVEDFERRYDLAVLDVYGLSETGPIAAVTWDHRRAGSCGRPVPWYDVRIVDEHDVELPRGESGQIVVRPTRPHVMMERYWGNDAATLALLRNLWLHTGDYARQDEDGFIWFLERATDSIRRRGENVSAWEVERIFADHADLLEAAVYGVPSEVGGQEIMVAVVLRPGVELTAEDLLDFCNGKMPHFAVPRYVRFMDALPRNHAQRVLKQQLKSDGVDVAGVWDREAVGYVVQR
jgi:crotonobetaine/carnitine-CoA ligase